MYITVISLSRIIQFIIIATFVEMATRLRKKISLPRITFTSKYIPFEMIKLIYRETVFFNYLL